MKTELLLYPIVSALLVTVVNLASLLFSGEHATLERFFGMAVLFAGIGILAAHPAAFLFALVTGIVFVLGVIGMIGGGWFPESLYLCVLALLASVILFVGSIKRERYPWITA